eukprot:6440362-Prymnesium_polylepis.1
MPRSPYCGLVRPVSAGPHPPQRSWRGEPLRMRRDPRWYFQSLLAFVNVHKSGPADRVKFMVHMHGAMQQSQAPILEPLVRQAASPAKVAFVYCPVYCPEYSPWQFPLSNRIVPAIDSENNEI